MENNTIIQTTKAMEELFEIIMKMYWEQLNTLEIYINKIPDTEEALLGEMNELLLDIKASMEHDIGIFTKAINSDAEDLHGIQDKLRINDIYSKLNKQ